MKQMNSHLYVWKYTTTQSYIYIFIISNLGYDQFFDQRITKKFNNMIKEYTEDTLIYTAYKLLMSSFIVKMIWKIYILIENIIACIVNNNIFLLKCSYIYNI